MRYKGHGKKVGRYLFPAVVASIVISRNFVVAFFPVAVQKRSIKLFVSWLMRENLEAGTHNRKKEVEMIELSSRRKHLIECFSSDVDDEHLLKLASYVCATCMGFDLCVVLRSVSLINLAGSL